MTLLRNTSIYGEDRGQVFGIQIGKYSIIWLDKWGVTFKILENGK